MQKAGDELNTVLDDLIKYNVINAEKANHEGNALYSSAHAVTIAIIIVAVIVSLVFGYFISQVIARPLGGF